MHNFRGSFLMLVVFITMLAGITVSKPIVTGDFVSIVQKVSTSYVTILDRANDDRVVGSGIIVTMDGRIITAGHVYSAIEKGKIDVEFVNGKILPVVKAEIPNDLIDIAVLYVDATNLTPITFADSNQVRQGEWAMALGAPFGLKDTVTVGIVSATMRSITLEDGTKYTDLIQVDTPVNPGNSGGMIVNINGELIGMTVLRISGDGIGFAISSNMLRDYMWKSKLLGREIDKGVN